MTATQQRIDTAWLVALIALTGFLAFLGAISYVNRIHFEESTDGLEWVLRDGSYFVESVEPNGPGVAAGLARGDRLVMIAGVAPEPVPEFVYSVLWDLIPGSQIPYVVDRSGVELEFSVEVGSSPIGAYTYFYLCLVGAASLFAGLFALLRRPEADSGLAGKLSGVPIRFFWLAAAFYAVLVLYETRSADPLSNTIFWVDQLARNALPGLFLYFALTFPRPADHFVKQRLVWLVGIFGPGAVLFASYLTLTLGAERLGLTPTRAYDLFRFFSNLDLMYIATALGLGVLLIAHSYKFAESPIERRRLTWLVGGMAVGMFPFIAVYVPLFVLGVTSPLLDLTVLPFVLIPVTFGYAAVGWRLWDVEVILKRALAYLVAALAVLGVYVGAEWGIRRLLTGVDPQFARAAAFAATLLVAFAFAPLRDLVQDGLDRLYYRDRYRSRRGILDFGRELNTELDLAQVVELLVQRVRKMLAVGRIAVLLRQEGGSRLRLVSDEGSFSQGRRLSEAFSEFLTAALANRDFIYVDDVSTLLDEFPEDREVLAEEDLAYFLPLTVKGEVVGLLALGRTLSGDYLSSEDLKVLQMLTSHAALALDNALLYRQAHVRAQELERLKTYNENIVESIKVGVLVLDTDGRVRSLNRSLEKIQGISGAEAVGRTLDELFPSSFVSALEQARERVDEENAPIASAYRVALRNRDNVDHIVNLSVAPLLGEEGRYATVVIVDDVTDQTELEAQLRQSDRLASIGLLAAGVAHEVNTPLAGISSYVQMLARKLPDSDPRRPILEKIEKQTFRASSIVNNLLNFSRQEASEMQAVDLNSVISDTLTLAELPLTKRKVRVEMKLAESLPAVWGDSGKLQQVLMNLVINARDSMPNGGDLTISTAHYNGEVVLEVADTGAGIPKDEIHKIYDPFYTTKETGKGTGLGLSVTYGIIQEHRGSITVRSDKNSGTSFRVALPVASAGRARAAS